ncbi:UNVERIFIED_ORG: invasion protein IalB [Methylobacterium sp. SuP10 SLI 274]|nr:invasion protein IalB [Methylobacterium sp. SuP10 SLI 274]
MSLFAGVVRALRPGTGRRLALVAATAATVLAAGGAAQAQGTVRKTFDDWQLRCETPAGAKAEQCALVQYVAAEDRPNLNLVVIVLKIADNRGYLLRVQAPLGILLTSGLAPQDRSDRYRPRQLRALPDHGLRRRGGDG